jgi:Domain of unknown function (DUF397)
MSMDPSVGSVATWRKSRHSMTNGNCVEIAADSGAVFARDTANRAAAMIRYPAQAWSAFLAGVKAGQYDPAADLAREFGSGTPTQTFVRRKLRYDLDGVGPRWSW